WICLLEVFSGPGREAGSRVRSTALAVEYGLGVRWAGFRTRQGAARCTRSTCERSSPASPTAGVPGLRRTEQPAGQAGQAPGRVCLAPPRAGGRAVPGGEGPLPPGVPPPARLAGRGRVPDRAPRHTAPPG